MAVNELKDETMNVRLLADNTMSFIYIQTTNRRAHRRYNIHSGHLPSNVQSRKRMKKEGA